MLCVMVWAEEWLARGPTCQNISSTLLHSVLPDLMFSVQSVIVDSSKISSQGSSKLLVQKGRVFSLVVLHGLCLVLLRDQSPDVVAAHVICDPCFILRVPIAPKRQGF